MLSTFRALAKSPVAKVLFFVLGASFLLWGIHGQLGHATFSDAVIQAGPRSVGEARFRQMFEDELKQYSQQSGQTLTVQDALAHGLDRQVADQMAADEATAEYIRRLGIIPSDKLVVGEIAKAPRFFNAVSGAFDKSAYSQFLQQIGMTAPQFEGVLRDELARSQFLSGMAAPLQAPLLYSALAAAYNGEGRSFSDFGLGPSAVAPPTQPSDADLNTFIKAHAQQLMRPETRVFTGVQFSTTKTAAGQAADPAAVQKRFEFEKDTLSTPEKRTLVQIPVKNAATAAGVVSRLKAGTPVADAAKFAGTQPLTYADSPKSAIADRKLADAAFAMSAGQVQGPVAGDLGLAVLQLQKVTPGHVETLDEARPKIEAEVKADAARTVVDKQVKAYEDARSGGANLIQAAKTVGVQTVTLPPVTAQGTTLQRQQIPIPPKALQAGFALAAGADSDIIDLGQGEYVALRLEKIIAPAPPALEEIKPLLTRVVMQQDMLKRLQAKADAIADQVRKGQSLDAAARAAGATPGNAVAVQRQGAGQTFSPDLIGRVFAAKVGDVVVAQDVKPGLTIARLTAIVPATAKDAAQAAANLRPSASQAVAQDVANAIRTAARAAIKPKVDYKRAHAALGGDAGPAQ